MSSSLLATYAQAFIVEQKPGSEAVLTGTVPFDALLPYRDRALAHIAEHLELPGFRPGHVPPAMAEKRVGEMAVLEEAADLFIRDFYPVLVETHTLDVVGRPDVRITKLAAQNPVAFVITVSVYPEVVLPNGWETIHEQFPPEPVADATDEEVQKTIESLRESRKVVKEDGTEELPELDDAFAASIGAFKNLEEMKAQIHKGITEEKARTARDARRGKIIEALLSKLTLDVPNIFIESELDKILSQLREDVTRFGMTLEEYLQKTNKTEDAVREEFRDQAKKRATLQLVLNKIAADEKVEADQTVVDAEMEHALEHFPDARPELLRIHIETVLRNEKTLKILEGSKE